MKTLYLECNMGASGDMLMAALLELHPAPEDFLVRLNELHIPDVSISAQPSVKCGITGTHISVIVNGEEEESVDVDDLHHSDQHEHNDKEKHDHKKYLHHSGIYEIENIISNLKLPEKVRTHVLEVYGLIAEAESHAHGKPVPQIHFHEVGTMDAITDIAGVCLLLHELAPEQILASPINVGSGQVRCAHGILPVPAPATAFILQDVPIYGGMVCGELCTPTGAALLKHFVSEFVTMPTIRISKIGYGMGNKDFEVANCVRAMMGEIENGHDSIVELCCNLDDMTPEAVGFATEQLFAGGALDVHTTAVQMKKNRPGILLTCMCGETKRETILQLIFQHTTTLGVREHISNRYTLTRSQRIAETEYGPVRIKQVSGWGVQREKAEYEDLAKIAREQELSLADVMALLEKS